MFPDVYTWLDQAVGLSPQIVNNLLLSLLVVLLVWLLRRLLLGLLYAQFSEPVTRYRLSKWSSYGSVALAFLLVGGIWLHAAGDLFTYLGLLSAGIAIALRDPLTNLAGWFFIVIRRPFSVGDRVEMEGIAGDVIDIRIFEFTLMEIGRWVDADQSTGRIIHMPNSLVFTKPLANYTHGLGFIWNEIPVLVTFESNWQAAKRILQQIADDYSDNLSEAARQNAQRAAKKFLIFYTHLEPTVYTSVQDSGVLLTLRYLCEPRSRRSSTQVMWEGILEAFSERQDIDFAYPTHRLYDNVLEGKPEARAQPGN